MKTVLKLAVCWAVFGVSLVLSGILNHLFHLHINMPPIITSLPMHMFAILGAGGLLVLGLYPMTHGLVGSAPARSTALGVFLFLALGVNTVLDGAIYTNYFAGAIPAHALTFALQALFTAVALGFLFDHAGELEPVGLPRRNWLAWAGRGLAAWLAWPFIYFGFGMCVAPVVVPYYLHGAIPGLHIPPVGTIFAVQFVRSVLFLASSLPLIALWKGSRRGLWLALGLAHTFAVGIYGLVVATFMPMVLRLTHGVEITADSFVYAGLLVLLFGAPAGSAAESAAELEEPQVRSL